MARFRNFKTNKVCNFMFVFIFILLFVLYFIYIYEFMIRDYKIQQIPKQFQFSRIPDQSLSIPQVPQGFLKYKKRIFFYCVCLVQSMIRLNPSFNVVTIPISILLFIMLAWSLFMSYIVEPGNVPKYYALYNQDRNQQRKYCLQCHNFKPQRSHHCSTCAKCILNMDHHCPIINNCLGFHNRKHFLLLLFYLILILAFAGVQQVYLVIIQIIRIFQGKQKTDIHTAIRLLTVIGETIFLFMMIFFFKMHFQFVLDNTTTLQQMIKKRKIQKGQKIEQRNIYDIGIYKNFTQVFGQNAFEWFLPINTDDMPCDGMNWPKNKCEQDTQKQSMSFQNRMNGQNQKQKVSFKNLQI